ncbi:hypothetical protein DFQ13_104279 [Actinokineospora spheciospongiae]|nr:hypothetical protein DFQ13_104279 [Actinokineospora spheciospongiae]
MQAVATGGHFALAEPGVVATPDFAENGLVVAILGGVAVRTGVAAGQVKVGLDVFAEPPSEVAPAVWDEVVEVSWTAKAGFATLIGGRRTAAPRRGRGRTGSGRTSAVGTVTTWRGTAWWCGWHPPRRRSSTSGSIGSGTACAGSPNRRA